MLGDAPRLVRVVDTDAHEGPVYSPGEDALYFTSLPRPGSSGFPEVSIKRLALDGARFPVEPERITVVRESANVANGMALDLEGRLVVCEQGTRSQHAAISRDRVPLVDEWRGMRLNSPNDVVVKSDGTIWFSDPSYGFLQGFKPEPQLGDNVYRYDPSSERLSVVADGFDKPNGLCFSPDERVLYVADNGGPHHLKAFDVVDGRRLRGERLLAVSTPEHPDGLKADSEGRVYATFSGGIEVYSPEGDLIGEIVLPGAVNFTFGGPDRNVLLITRDDSIWAALINAAAPSRLKEA